jgi:hypothetical protein
MRTVLPAHRDSIIAIEVGENYELFSLASYYSSLLDPDILTRPSFTPMPS